MLLFLIGVLVGTIIASILLSNRSGSGVLKIDHSDPEKDVYRFEINDLDSLNKKKEIVLKIDHNADLSQN